MQGIGNSTSLNLNIFIDKEKKMNIETMYEQIPASWDDVTLNQFQKIMTVEIEEDSDVLNGVQNTLGVISKLTDVPINELEDLPMGEIQKLAKKLDFIVVPPTSDKKDSVIKWKSLDEITYNDYVNFIQLREKMTENLHVFVKNFSKVDMTDEEILALPIEEVLVGFFLLKQMLLTYLNNLLLLEKKRFKKLVRQELKRKS